MCLLGAHITSRGKIIIPIFFRIKFLFFFIFMIFLYGLLLVTPYFYALFHVLCLGMPKFPKARGSFNAQFWFHSFFSNVLARPHTLLQSPCRYLETLPSVYEHFLSFSRLNPVHPDGDRYLNSKLTSISPHIAIKKTTWPFLKSSITGKQKGLMLSWKMNLLEFNRFTGLFDYLWKTKI